MMPMVSTMNKDIAMWFDALIDSYRNTLGHCFLLHGVGVDDSVAPGLMLGPFLRRQLVRLAFDVVLFYDAAGGISFPDDIAAAIHRERVEKGESVEKDYEPMRVRAARAIGLL